MRFGLHVPQLGALAEPRAIVDLARRAEAAGWDGYFVWDHVMHRGDPPACDPWVALGAIAVSTERLVLGPMITPLPRRRPWRVARETTTLDRLSGGRTVLGVGIGTDAYGEFSAFAEPALDDRTRAAMLDEALEVVTALWRGMRISHTGE
ncbi:MAG: LLM class flavin-dependent oxidoreductase, partial [Acidimicrobiia bacterium]|nr:LLM class flavin-dependent oxidoreductase [Acidimicrobiia bacterium]